MALAAPAQKERFKFMWGYNNKNIVLHELIGLSVKVAKSHDRFRRGVKGIIIDETKNLLVIRTAEGTVKRIPKENSTFVLKPGKGKSFTVNGEEIMFRSHERTEKALKYYRRRNKK
ncbi:MAG: ribonuclease P protein component 1 [Candidatus Micrarchaeia archaeon]